MKELGGSEIVLQPLQRFFEVVSKNHDNIYYMSKVITYKSLPETFEEVAKKNFETLALS